jgi:hypothetical protein
MMKAMDKEFNAQEAKKFLEIREAGKKEQREQNRKHTLQTVIASLEHLFAHTAVEVYLVGSITQPYSFHSHSDVDIVLKNFTGDRFDIWTKLEKKIKKRVEVIIFEHCHFQEHIIKSGYKVL